MINVSVIVPVYNAEKYLSRCINSLLEQTLDNIEIIIVNDGSTDNSAIILNEFKSNYSNIIVFNQDNQGVSVARNNALKYARGKYLFFIDSDDYLKKDVLKLMYIKAEKEGSDIVIGKFNLIIENSNYCTPNIDYLDEDLNINKIEGIKELFKLEKFQSHVCGKLYQKKLFDNIKFPHGIYYEDLAIMYRIFFHANKISYINICTYEYFIRANSICTGDFCEKHLDFINIIDEIEAYLVRKKIYTDLEKEFNSLKLKTYIILGFDKVSYVKDKKYRRKILINLKENIKRQLKSKDININKKELLFVFIIRYFLFMYPVALKLQKKLTNLYRNIKVSYKTSKNILSN